MRVPLYVVAAVLLVIPGCMGSHDVCLVGDDVTNERRRGAVVAATKHAWDGYRKYGWGYDELRPLSKTGTNTFSGMGITVLDSLDTLWLMGLESRFRDARRWVAKRLRLDSVGKVSIFETTIRGLGGLLGAYELTGDRLFLEKAEDLGYRLSTAFGNSRMPYPECLLSRRTCPATWRGDHTLLAEVGSIQLEFHALSRLSDRVYLKRLGARTREYVRRLGAAIKPEHNGVPPCSVRVSDGSFVGDRRTFGAPSDSFFEYLAKAWIQSGKEQMFVRDTFRASMKGLQEMTTSIENFGVLVRDHVNGEYRMQMDHFTCYVPGMVFVGLDAAESAGQRMEWIQLAENITDTCMAFYRYGEKGLAGDTIYARDGEFTVTRGYELRPETVEALFYMWRQTGNNKYREWAWEIFQQIEAHCKTEVGYAVLEYRDGTLRQSDVMHSFFLAETLKYLFLIFSDNDTLALDTFVLTTEAHPLRIDHAS